MKISVNQESQQNVHFEINIFLIRLVLMCLNVRESQWYLSTILLVWLPMIAVTYKLGNI